MENSIRSLGQYLVEIVREAELNSEPLDTGEYAFAVASRSPKRSGETRAKVKPPGLRDYAPVNNPIRSSP